MIAFILLATAGLGLWFFSGTYFKGKAILRSAGVGIAIVSFMLLFVGFIKGDLPYQMYIVSFPIIAYGMYLVWKLRNNNVKKLKIIANQQRYWNEVKASDVYQFFKYRKNIKKNRIEIDVNREEKKLEKDGCITPSFFVNLQGLQLTKINKVSEIHNNPLHSIIFKKIKGIMDDKEINDLDNVLEKTLKENDNYAEYFLMYLWENYTKDINIGTANLPLKAKNLTEEELIGALDNLFLKSVIYKGASLYYAYMSFHDRIKNYQKQEEQSDSEDEEEEYEAGMI